MVRPYSLFVSIAKILAPYLARSNKGKAFVKGRKEIWAQLETVPKNAKTVWMHCASLGEYEQGLPVLQELKAAHPDYFYVITFFSSSGYEVRKNHGVANMVTYLPWDTKADVKRFVATINPELVMLVKYEFWPNLIREIQRRQMPLFLVSGLFRKHQLFFKPWGGGYRKLLRGFTHLFVQNEQSLQLLNQIDVKQASVSGDTRFDRVGAPKAPLPFMELFCNGRKCIVAGSTWPEDEAVLFDAVAQTPSDWCWLIAPHEMHEEKLHQLKAKLPEGSVRYTQTKASDLGNCPVLILDTVGMLSRCYPYGHIAYVGGAMGTSGLHNILEPAAEGIPVIIGKNYTKFPEANALIEQGGVISISSAEEFSRYLFELIQNDRLRQEKGVTNRTYITQNQGATEKTLLLLNRVI